MIGGRYLAEITREVFSDLEANKYNLAEYRVSIYGRKPDECVRIESETFFSNFSRQHRLI